jgi:hypothetical protein
LTISSETPQLEKAEWEIKNGISQNDKQMQGMVRKTWNKQKPRKINIYRAIILTKEEKRDKRQ